MLRPFNSPLSVISSRSPGTSVVGWKLSHQRTKPLLHLSQLRFVCLEICFKSLLLKIYPKGLLLLFDRSQTFIELLNVQVKARHQKR